VEEEGMTEGSSNLPVGLGGLRYPITQTSLAIQDLDATMERYYQAFGWAPWQVFDHVLPMHHNTEVRGESVHYSLRGAEVYVGKMNFELLQPLEGPNLWSEFMDRRGEGIASIATMFHERVDGDEVKRQFQERFGISVSMKADIGDHIEYYYLDTEEQFGMLIESGSGHAIDFVGPAKVYPSAGSEQVPAPESGILYPTITQVSAVTRDLDRTVANFHTAFGWGPWRIFDSSDGQLFRDCLRRGEPVEPFKARWAQAMIGDETRLELIQPLGGWSPWQETLDTDGEGLFSISVMFDTEEGSQRVKDAFAERGTGIYAGARFGDREWYYLDTKRDFKCLIQSGSGHAYDHAEPASVFPAP
jgi:methylmalonyl-CoA/ethylmalonyl-CoA epimerase